MRVFRRLMLNSGVDLDSIPNSQKMYYTATEVVVPKKDSIEGIIANVYDLSTGNGTIVTNKDITTIGERAFEDNTSLTSIKLPPTIKQVKLLAFANTSNLKDIYLASGGIEFQNSAFFNTGIERVIVDDSNYNSVVDLIASNTCAGVNASPFYSKSATLWSDFGNQITGGPIIRNIGDYTFAGVSGISSIMLFPTDEVRHIGKGAFYASPSNFYLGLNSKGTTIGDGAFSGSNLYATSTFEVIQSLGQESFAYCKQLKNAPVKISVEVIPLSAFESSDILNVTIYSSVKTIQPYAFLDCNIDVMSINGDNIDSAGAFQNCVINNLILNATFADRGSVSGLSDAVIYNLSIQSHITTIQEYLFSGCKFKMDTLELPSTIKSIGDKSFYASTFNRLVIPDTTTTIGKYAFSYSKGKYIKIGKEVVSFGNLAFATCQIETYDFSDYESVPTLSSHLIFNPSNDFSDKIVVPDLLYDEWISATNWSYLYNRIIKKSDWDASQTTE